MSKVVHVQTNFTAGELSPRLFGRVDLTKYNNGASTIQNAVVQTHGGLTRRTGTRYVAGVRDDSLVPRLVEYHYNTEQSYVLEVGVTQAGAGDYGYIRPFRLDSNGLPYQLDTDGDGTGTIIERTGLPFRDTELSTLSFTQSADTMYVFCPTRPILKIQRTGNDLVAANWEWTALTGATNGFTDGPYLDMNITDISFSVDMVPHEDDGVSVVLSAHVNDLDGGAVSYYFTANDVGRAVRLEDAARGYKVLSFTPNVGSPKTSAVTCKGLGLLNAVSASGLGGSSNLLNGKVEFYDVARGPVELDDTLHSAREFTEMGNTGNTYFKLFHADTGVAEPYRDMDAHAESDIDGFVRLSPMDNAGWGIITGVVADSQDGSTGTYSQVNVTVKKKFLSIEKTKNWRLGAWYVDSDGTGIFPKTGTFHQNRLWCGSTSKQPQTLWASEVNAYDVFSPTDLESGQVVDSQAMTITLASRHVNGINHMKSDGQGLVVFTTGGEWLGRAQNPTAPVTPTDVSFTKQSSYGSLEGVEPIRLGTSYLMFQRDALTMREFSYQFSQDKFVAPNVTILAEHITRNKVKDLTFQMGGTQRIWCATETGELLSMTYDKEQEVMAWSKHIMGGSGGNIHDATVTITAFTELNSADKINLIATDGTNYDFVCGDQSAVNGTWEATFSNNQTAINLMNVINTSSGPAGTRFTATVDGAVVTITQAVNGADGNTPITLTDSGNAGMSKTDFTAATGAAPIAGLVDSVARTTDANEDNVWMLVKREVIGADKYFIEMLTQDFQVTDDHKNAFFLDCGLSGYEGTATVTWSGLDHLLGESVYVLADSVQQGPFTVVDQGGGNKGITLTTAANDVVIGLRYETVVETVPLNVQQSLESRGKKKRIFTAYASMYRSLSGKIGTKEQVYDIEYATATSSPPELRTALVEVSIPDNANREMFVRFEQEDAHPSNLLAITSEIYLGV